MYNAGDLIVYGTTGVCRVESVGEAAMSGAPADKLYYKLTPLIRGGVIYTPTDTRVSMRPAISAEEAEAVLRQVPSIQPDDLTGHSVHELGEIYAAAIAEGSLAGLAKLAMSIYRRKLTPEKQRCRYGRVDVKYIKLAEELLCGEVSVVLGEKYEDVLRRFFHLASMSRGE